MLRYLPLVVLSILSALIIISGCDDAATVPETGQVRGVVKRMYSRLPVVGAVVSMAGESVTTDAGGNFQFSSIPQGDGAIHVTADEFRDLHRDILVESYQYFDLEMMPLDSVVSITGRVHHRVDGAVQCMVEVEGVEVATDSEGNWTMEEVGLGPISLLIDHASYNLYTTEVLVHSDGQLIEQFVTRDTVLTWLVEDDAYIFTEHDSLNANRGATRWLHVTNDLGRTAYFTLDHPDFPYHWATLAEGWLDLHGFLLQDSGDPVSVPATVEFTTGVLDTLFGEGALDYAYRPDLYPGGSLSFILDESPLNQPFSIDLKPVYQNAPFRGAWGVTLGTTTDQLPLIILSSEYDDEADRPRVRLIYRF